MGTEFQSPVTSRSPQATCTIRWSPANSAAKSRRMYSRWPFHGSSVRNVAEARMPRESTRSSVPGSWRSPNWAAKLERWHVVGVLQRGRCPGFTRREFYCNLAETDAVVTPVMTQGGSRIGVIVIVLHLEPGAPWCLPGEHAADRRERGKEVVPEVVVLADHLEGGVEVVRLKQKGAEERPDVSPFALVLQEALQPAANRHRRCGVRRATTRPLGTCTVPVRSQSSSFVLPVGAHSGSGIGTTGGSSGKDGSMSGVMFRPPPTHGSRIRPASARRPISS